MSASAPPLRRRLAGLAPFLLALLALPLLAPTCGGQQPGLKAFSKGSLIIPMDACSQGTAGAAPTGCPGAADAGDVIRAYGLVYQLVRANVPVYWVIAPDKAALAAEDFRIQFDNGAPVLKYAWGNDSATARPPNNPTNVAAYRGGPFVVDGTDAAAARAVMQQAATRSAFQTVNVHVSQVAFQANVAKSLVGGWSAGGAIAPKLALLNVPGGDGRYADHVLEGYLIKAGLAPACVLNNPPCADTSAGTATPTGHGVIYDRLEAADFLPPTCTSAADCPAGSACIDVSGTAQKYCDWKSTRLFQNGYKVLWLPHWKGPNSCEGTLGAGYACGTGFGGCSTAGGDACSCVNTCTSNLSVSELDAVLATVGGYQAAGNDLFGECAGLGTLEGVFSGGAVDGSFADGNALSRFQTSAASFPSGGGLHITTSVTGAACSADASGMTCAGGELYQPSYFPSPFLQIGDFPYDPVSGAITEFRPASGNGASGYVTGTASLISRLAVVGGVTTKLDYFTFLPAAGGHGNVVYLGGHDYSGNQGTFQVAGTRLVLNTLFNLTSVCTSAGQPCNTGLLGACSQGTLACDPSGNPVCQPTVSPRAETCNGVDDDCNGVIDDLPPSPCFTGSSGCTLDAGTGQYTCRGVCASGQQSCTNGQPGACVGQILPTTEACNGLDDDCNGLVDDGVPPPGGSASCYSGPSGTAGKGLCKAGAWTCAAGAWSCQNEVLPATEICEPAGTDENCDGQIDENCACVPGTRRACYGADPATANIGACRSGEQTCDAGGRWGGCAGQVLPATESCNGVDDDCNGLVDDGGACDECRAGQTRPCYTGPAGTQGQGTCQGGVESCGAGGKWSGNCAGEITPGPERCDGKDNDCDGQVDDGALCPAGLTCLNGVCATGTWSPESSCFPGYDPLPGGTCAASPCPAQPCAAGQVCRSGSCADPCTGTAAPRCGSGSICSGGACVGGGCYAAGCPAGEVCRFGACGPDACSGVSCPAGTFCRPNGASSGTPHDCVQSCAFVRCAAGERCSPDGFCVADPCASVSCGPNQLCRGGSCVADPCVGVTCGDRQVCRVVTEGGQDLALCGDDACAGIVCPAGQCVAGQCFASNNLTGDGPKGGGGGGGADGSSKSGCGCGGGQAGPTALLLALLGLPLAGRRRRRLPRGGAALLLFVAVLAAGPGCGKKSEPAPPPPTDCETCGTSACVDVKFSDAHCASCGRACGAGQICVDAVCGPGSPVAPLVQAVADLQDPGGQVVAGTTPALRITGQRFEPGAQVRVSGAVAPVTLDAAAVSFVSAGELRAAVDLSAANVGVLTVRVVNPAQVISNAFEVGIVAPSPFVTSLAPSSALAGSQPEVVVTGRGFTRAGTGRVGSVCIQKSGSLEQGASTIFVSATELRCTLDLRTLPPGPITVLVQNDGKLRSSPQAFTVSGHDPVVQSVSPSGARQGDRPRLLLAGDGFEPGSQVQFEQQDLTWRELATTYVAVTRLQADLILTGDSPGAYRLRVSNGGGAKVSAPVPFTVGANAPTLAGLTTTPALPRLGDSSLALALSGTGFSAACKVEVLRPGGVFSPTGVATGFQSQGALGATVDPAAGDAAGTWSARVNCAGNCATPPPSPLPPECTATAAIPFQVLSNVAQLVTVTPPSGAQGSSPTLAVTGLNFLPGAVLVLTPSESGGTTTTLTPTSVTDTAITATVSLAAVAAGSYVLTAVNPPGGSATTSNGLSFAVTPGRPVISSTSALACTAVDGRGTCTATAACGASTCSAACAVQGPSNVRVTLNGSFFGQGSTVHASSAAVADLDLGSALHCATPPCARVQLLGADRIQVDIDPTEIPAGAYQIAVWNPGASGVQKSDPTPFKVSTATCP